MTTAKFNELYKKLNPRQKEAVDTVEGPVMVVAGPGTGKTQILTLRIANILRKTDASPDSILALTFTESGVYSMRKRLVEIIGPSAYRVPIFTFHGFANDLIRRFPDEFPRIIGSNNVNDIDKIILLKDIISGLDLLKLRPFGDNFYYLIPALQKISEFKRENISPDRLEELISMEEKKFGEAGDLYHEKGRFEGQMKGKYKELEKNIEKTREFLLIYRAYEKALGENRLYDYEDMIIEAIRAMEKSRDFLLSIQEEYQYVLADEHQDANNGQNRLLELLVSFHDSPNIFIVGDEKQAIFRFQGASLENFLYFKKLYPQARLVALEQNYRSSQLILDSAHSLINKSAEVSSDLRPRLRSFNGVGEKIELYSFSKSEFEYAYLVRDIEDKISQGVNPEEIAVFYRYNRDSEPLIRSFEKTLIPFVVESDQNILSDKDIENLITIFKTIENFGNDELLLRCMYIDVFDIDPLDIYKLANFSWRSRTPISDILSSRGRLAKAILSGEDKLYSFYKKISAWKKTSRNKPLLDFFEIVVRESGMLDHLLSGDLALEKIEKLSGLFEDLKTLIENHRSYDLEKFLQYMDLLEEHGVSVRKNVRGSVPGSVHLMTAHRSKGLEFDYIYIINAYDTHWGNNRSIEHFKIYAPSPLDGSFEKIDDERRLFYVALTRARIGVNISYSKEDENGKSRLPSQFIEEISKEFIKEGDVSEYEKKFENEKFKIFAPRAEVRAPVKDKKFLNMIFFEQGLSVTALNNFLECPWNFFYSNLLRVPKVPNKFIMFGSAVHGALSHFFDALKIQGECSKNTLIRLYEDKLRKEPLTDKDLDEMTQKGKRVLSGYYDKYISSCQKNVFNEFKVSIFFDAGVGEGPLRLTGNLDKIEILNGAGEVNVVDYKTGKPKSRNEIEGKTKNSNGNYKRQLVFYNMLLDNYENKKFRMVSGEIDFVEPDQKGEYHKEKFVVSVEDIKKLEEEIKNSAKEIMDLAFWNRYCSDKKCEYCRMRKKCLS